MPKRQLSCIWDDESTSTTDCCVLYDIESTSTTDCCVHYDIEATSTTDCCALYDIESTSTTDSCVHYDIESESFERGIEHMYTSWKGRIIGSIIGLFFGGVGIIIGFAIGYFLYDKPRNDMVRNHAQARNAFTGHNTNPAVREQLIKTTFRLMGYVSRGAGHINKTHIKQAEYFMSVMELDANMRELAKSSFNLGKREDFDLDREVNKLVAVFGNNPTILSYLMEIQVSVAIADELLEPGEHERLILTAMAFGIPANSMEQLIRVRMAQINFANFSRQYTEHRQREYQRHGNSGSYNTYGNQSYENYEKYGYDKAEQEDDNDNTYTTSSSSDLDNAYQILGVTRDTSWEDIRRAHKKLMLKYHPDRLAAQGLPPEMMSIYTQKAQDIQAAFSLIKKHLGK